MKSIISKTRYSKIKASIVGEVYTNYVRPPLENCTQVTDASTALDFIRANWGDNIDHVETVKVAYLNRANYIVAFSTIGTGGVSGCVADIKVIFQKALACNACGLILSHNHPSGNTGPSDSDKELTQKVKQAAKILDMRLLDHVIITTESYFSFAENGLI